MAGQVPYTGVPDVEFQAPPIPTRQLDVPANAFGANVGAAVQHMGEVATGVGNELYTRAVALQQLDLDAKASERNADFVTTLGKRFGEYVTKQGKDAVDGFQPFLDDMEKIRAEGAKDLPPYAQKLYNQESRRTFSQTTFSAARHMGEQNKVYQLGTLEATRAADRNLVLNDHTNPAAVADARRRIVETGRTEANIRGWGPEQEAAGNLDAQTKLTTNLVMAGMDSDPFEAEKKLEDAHEKGLISGNVYLELSDKVKRAQDIKGSTQIAAKTWNEPGSQDLTAEEFARKLRQKADEQRPGDAAFAELTVAHGETMRNRERTNQRADEFDRRTTLAGAVQGINNQDGKLPTTIEDFDPKSRAMFDSANPDTQSKILKVLRQNAKGDYAPTPDNQRLYNQIRGALIDPTKDAAEREKALTMDIMSLPIPAQQRSELLKEQIKLQKDSTANPALSRGLRVIQPMITDPALGLSKTKNPDDYNMFIGGFEEAMRQRMADEKRPLKDDEIRQIGSRLIQDMDRKWYQFTPNKKFQAEVPEEFKTKILDIYKKTGEPLPTDREIHSIYLGQQMRMEVKKAADAYQEQFGKSKPSTSDIDSQIPGK